MSDKRVRIEKVQIDNCMGERDIKIKLIQGKLHRKGDSIYIPDLRCSGTILRFHRQLVLIQPHDYGSLVRRLPNNLRIGCVINYCVRLTLQSLKVYIRDELVLKKGTFPVSWKQEYVEPYF